MKKRQRVRTERRELADGTVKEYHYAVKPKQPKQTNTLGALVALWHDSPQWEKLGDSTKAAYVRYVAHLYSEFKLVQFKEIRRKHLIAIRNRIAKNQGHGAADGFGRAVSSLFGWAVENEHLDSSPATKLRKGLDHGTLPTWTMEQALIAIDKLPRPYSRAVQFAMHTAQRRGDICKMRWDDYDGTYLTFVQEKGAKKVDPVPHSMMVNPELKTILDAWKLEARGLTILEGADGTPLKKGVLSVRLPKELARIGLPSGLNIHGLRKLASVTMADGGCSTHQIASVTGHKTLAMVQLYTSKANQRNLTEAVVHQLYPNTKVTKTQKS